MSFYVSGQAKLPFPYVMQPRCKKKLVPFHLLIPFHYLQPFQVVNLESVYSGQPVWSMLTPPENGLSTKHFGGLRKAINSPVRSDRV